MNPENNRAGYLFACQEVLLWSIAAATGLLFPGVTTACLPDVNSRIETSLGEEYVLVMVSPLPAAQDKGNRPLDPAQGGVWLRDRYRQSGLYRNDGSTEPLWRIPFTDGNLRAHMAPDGTCVVFDADPCDLGRHAVTIYADGRHVVTCWKQNLIRCYTSKRVLAMLCGWRSVDPIRGGLDHEKRTYRITTEQGEVFVLDVASGQLLRHVSPWPRYVVSFVLLVPTVVALIWYRPCIHSLISRAGWNLARHERSRSLRPGWKRISLRSVLVGITLLCVALALRKFVVPSAFLGTAAAIAGVVAILVRFSFRSFFIGGVLGCYGCILAFILGDFIGPSLFQFGAARDYFLMSAPFGGLLFGALAAGIIERKHVRRDLAKGQGTSRYESQGAKRAARGISRLCRSPDAVRPVPPQVGRLNQFNRPEPLCFLSRPAERILAQDIKAAAAGGAGDVPQVTFAGNLDRLLAVEAPDKHGGVLRSEPPPASADEPPRAA